MVKNQFMAIRYQKKVLNIFVYLINFVFRMGKNYYPQVFLEECKYIYKKKKKKKKKILKYITKYIMKFLLMILIKKILMINFWSKIQMKKILMKKILTNKEIFMRTVWICNFDIKKPIFFIYIKMPTGCYQNNKENNQKFALERYQKKQKASIHSWKIKKLFWRGKR